MALFEFDFGSQVLHIIGDDDCKTVVEMDATEAKEMAEWFKMVHDEILKGDANEGAGVGLGVNGVGHEEGQDTGDRGSALGSGDKATLGDDRQLDLFDGLSARIAGYRANHGDN